MLDTSDINWNRHEDRQMYTRFSYNLQYQPDCRNGLRLLVRSVCIKIWIFVLGFWTSEYFKKEFVNREIVKQEFKKMMALMRSQNRQGANHRNGRRLGVTASIENGGLVEYFFGKDGNTCLQHERFVQFLRQLHDEVCEFPVCCLRNVLMVS